MSSLNLVDRVKIRLGGCVFVRMERRDGWSGELPVYAFRCPIHGTVEDHTHGWNGKLRCPICEADEYEPKGPVVEGDALDDAVKELDDEVKHHLRTLRIMAATYAATVIICASALIYLHLTGRL